MVDEKPSGETQSMGRIWFLGAGTPTPAAAAFGSTALLDLDRVKLLVDCGPAATRLMANAGVSPLDLDGVFLTHLHFDHCVDLPCLLLSHWDQNAASNRELPIYGPAPIHAFVAAIIGPDGAFKNDLEARINAPMSQKTYVNRGGVLPRPRPDFPVHELASGGEATLQGVGIKARKVEHASPWLTSLAYRFDVGSRSVVFAGDTGSLSAVAELAGNCEVLVVNCWNAAADIRQHPDDESLATPERAGAMAALANVEKLCISHLGYRSGQKGALGRQAMIDQVRKHFEGKLELIDEGDVITLH